MSVIVCKMLLWSIALIGKLTVVKLKSPFMSCDPIWLISDLNAPLNFDMTVLSVSAKPPSEWPYFDR